MELILQSITKFSLGLHYKGGISYLFVNGTEIHKFKQKIRKLKQLHYVWEMFQKTFL